MKVKGKLIQYQEIEISEKELINSLIIRYGFDSDDRYIVYVEDDKLIMKQILASHGSYDYCRVTVISEDKNDIELFNCLTRAKEIIELKERMNKGKE